MKKNLKRIARGLLGAPCFLPLLRRLWANEVFCVMLHRLGDRDPSRLSMNEGLKVSPGALESFIQQAGREGYTFLSMEELYLALTGRACWPGRALVFTFDDGYRDNLTLGLPLFKKYGVPFMIYLSVFYMETRATPWWYALEDLLLENTAILWEGRPLDVSSVEAKEHSFGQIREVALNSRSGAQAYVEKLCFENGFCPLEREDLFLDWDDVEVLAAESLATLGNHGYTHPNMKVLERQRTLREFETTSDLLRERAGLYLEHYAYPYGRYCQETVDVLQEMEAKTCVTTRPGGISKTFAGHLLELPRFGLDEGMGTEHILVSRTCCGLKQLLL